MRKTQAKKNVSLSAVPLVGMMAAVPFLTGLFFEWQSALATLYLLGWLLWCLRARGELYIPRNALMLCTAALVAFCAVCSLWAVDKGMVWMGVVKFLPLPLFVLSVYQLRPEQRRTLLGPIPWVGAGMTVLTFALSRIPALADFFLVNHRLAGFFQYPNTFALYLLLGVVLIVYDLRRGWDIACLAVLLFGIAASGSRSSFLLLIVLVLALLILKKDKKTRLYLAGITVLLVLGTAVYALVSGDVSAIGRYLTASISSSTLVGRLLYLRDALPVILRHPFGLGYMGYSYLQGSFQTGVYAVTYIHNELFQMLLDVGWLPTALCVYALCKVLLSENCGWTERLLALTVAAHSMLDFDLQFAAVSFVLLTALSLSDGECSVLRKKPPMYAIGAVLATISLWLGVSSALYSAGACSASAAVYPGNTNAWLICLQEAEGAEAMDATADRILSHNRFVSLAYSAKASAAFSDGDVRAMMDYKEQAIELSRYSLEEYLNYMDMLSVCESMYEAAGDEASAAVCRDKLRAIPERMQTVLGGTSALAWRISDKPNLTLPPEYQALAD